MIKALFTVRNRVQNFLVILYFHRFRCVLHSMVKADMILMKRV